MMNNITSIMAAQEAHVSIEDLPTLIDQLSQLFNESCELRTQLKQIGDNFMDFMVIYDQHKDRLSIVEIEIQEQFKKFISLHHLPRELLVPHEAELTDLIIRFAKLQTLIIQG